MTRKDDAVREIRAFNRFYTNVIGVVDRHILDSPYSLTEARVLYEIDRDPGITARRIRGILKIDEGYLSRTIEKLVSRGLIIRERSEADKRNFTLSLSDKGKTEFSALNGLSDRSVMELVRNLEPEETDALVSAMGTIEKILGKGAESWSN